MSVLDWIGYKKRLVNVLQELQDIVNELEPALDGTKGKLLQLMRAQLALTKILMRVLKSLPS